MQLQFQKQRKVRSRSAGLPTRQVHRQFSHSVVGENEIVATPPSLLAAFGGGDKPLPPGSGMAGETGNRGDDINRFIQPPPVQKLPLTPETGPEGLPDRYFVQLSQTEFRPGPPEAEGEASVVWLFDGFSADWFESNHEALPEAGWEGEAWDAYFLKARIFVIEVEIPLRLLGGVDLPGTAFSTIRQADEQGDEPTDWFELTVQGIGESPKSVDQIPVWIYPNLYTEGVRAVLMSLTFVAEIESERLERATNIDHLQVADVEQEVENALISLPSDWIIIFDVGQGNAAGICDPDGKVICYCDLGGGVMGNIKTFPPALGRFCFHHQPPVILTHWDFDHWSSANRSGGNASWHSTWIAPRQSSLGTSHHTLMRQIRKFGSLLLVPKAFTPGWRGRYHLERCTGPGRNHSGLAITLREKASGGQKILFPGDASYGHIPSFSGNNYLSVIVPHHGADMKTPTTPPKPPSTASRLVYSYGIKNTFRHPRKITRTNHHAAGWLDAKASTSPVSHPYARNTADRAVSGLGHILLDWSPPTTLPAMCCQTLSCSCKSASVNCDLQAQQL